MKAQFYICGLGNPGIDYQFTRHNIGYLCLDYIHKKFSFNNWADFSSKLNYCSGVINGEEVVLIKPLEYMNNSGKSLISFVNYFKIDIGKLLVIYDDVDLKFGTIRIRKKGSAGNHNGMKDIINLLKSQDILRIKLGIGPKPERIELKDYVLERFSKEEIEKLSEIFEKVSTVIYEMVFRGIDYIISRYSQ